MRDWLKEARLEKGLTMKEMAEKMGLSESYYCYIEKGQRQRDMDLSLAGGISKVLGVPMKKILIEEEELRRRGEI